MSDTATPALHRESDTLYRQIAEIWREKIVTGEYISPGTRSRANAISRSRLA